MKNPITYRMQIPFFHKKTEAEFQKDIYERYNDMVIRQTALHLGDELWGNYPLQPILDFATPFLPKTSNPKILEIGCSVGRWIAELAQLYPEGKHWGLDYSYQMLKRAYEFWIDEKNVYLDLTHKGATSSIELKSHSLKNLNFGLAKAESLPFSNESQDIVLSSFLFDRLQDPMKGLKEMYRVLNIDGTMILITPLNFYKKKFWDEFHPPIKIFHILTRMGFEILEWKEGMIVEEPLDCRGNAVKWNCVGLAAKKI